MADGNGAAVKYLMPRNSFNDKADLLLLFLLYNVAWKTRALKWDIAQVAGNDIDNGNAVCR